MHTIGCLLKGCPGSMMGKCFTISAIATLALSDERAVSVHESFTSAILRAIAEGRIDENIRNAKSRSYIGYIGLVPDEGGSNDPKPTQNPTSASISLIPTLLRSEKDGDKNQDNNHVTESKELSDAAVAAMIIGGICLSFFLLCSCCCSIDYFSKGSYIMPVDVSDDDQEDNDDSSSSKKTDAAENGINAMFFAIQQRKIQATIRPVDSTEHADKIGKVAKPDNSVIVEPSDSVKEDDNRQLNGAERSKSSAKIGKVAKPDNSVIVEPSFRGFRENPIKSINSTQSADDKEFSRSVEKNGAENGMSALLLAIKKKKMLSDDDEKGKVAKPDNSVIVAEADPSWTTDNWCSDDDHSKIPTAASLAMTIDNFFSERDHGKTPSIPLPNIEMTAMDALATTTHQGKNIAVSTSENENDRMCPSPEQTPEGPSISEVNSRIIASSKKDVGVSPITSRRNSIELETVHEDVGLDDSSGYMSGSLSTNSGISSDKDGYTSSHSSSHRPLPEAYGTDVFFLNAEEAHAGSMQRGNVSLHTVESQGATVATSASPFFSENENTKLLIEDIDRIGTIFGGLSLNTLASSSKTNGSDKSTKSDDVVWETQESGEGVAYH